MGRDAGQPRRGAKSGGVGGGTSDPATVLLIHADGTNGSTAFTDASRNPHTITAVGNAKISTAQSKFGGSSALFDGTGDVLTVPDSPDWAFGAGNFTVDFWVQFIAIADSCFLAQYTAPNTSFYFRYNGASNWFTSFSADGTTATNPAGASFTPSTGVWYHIAWVRTGNVLKFFVNGVQTGSDAALSITLFDSSLVLAIGAFSAGTACLNGYLDEVRISNGVARWTANFTPPTAPYS